MNLEKEFNMTSDVVLSAALRSNLLSLQNTQKAIDITQFRLATGRKVNSALDGPQSFFAAQALNNRASDLTRLLDGIGQSIQVIKAADNGVTALTTLIEQADSVAANARDALAAGQVEAKAVGDKDLTGINDLTDVSGVTAGDSLVFRITDTDGAALDLGTYNPVGGAASTATITVAALDSIDDLIAKINDLQIDDGNGNASGGQAFEAKLDDDGFLQIRSLNGGDFNLDFVSVNGGGTSDPDNLALASALGYGNVAQLVGDDGSGNNNVQFTALADVALRSFALYDPNGGDPELAQASDTLDVLQDSESNPLFGGIGATADKYIISINGGQQQYIDLVDANTQPISIQSFVDQINANSSLNTKIKASFDESTGQITIKAIDGSVQSIEIGVEDAVTANFGFGVTDDPTVGTGLVGAGGEQDVESIRLASAAADLAALESDYNRIRDQIDALVEDTGYRGTNLLNGDDLTTFFNEHRTSSLISKGVTFSAAGLGLDEADFARTASVDTSLDQTRAALESVRAFGSTLANDLSIIQTRQDFTNNLVNTLTAGADALVNADQNEEGAKLLALQTRQQLGVTSLALASQSQQSILRLF